MNSLNFAQIIADELKVKSSQVEAAIALLNEGATVPFISRYRKEATQGLDDIQLRQLETRLGYLTSLQERKQTILKSLEAQQKLTPELQSAVENTFSKTELEDIYRPYKLTRNSKALKAKEAGLDPLAQALLANPKLDPFAEAQAYVNAEKGIETAEAALSGAQDILTEQLSQPPGLVAQLRETLWREGIVTSRLVKNQVDEGEKFKDYYEYDEPIRKVPSHRALALFRGEQAGILKLKLELPQVESSASHPFLARIQQFHQLQFERLASQTFFSQIIHQVWRLKLAKSLETELFSRLREMAEQGAIEVFAHNLKDLLLAAPAGAKVTLALDPGFRTGVKLAIVDQTGKFLHHGVIYPHAPQSQWDQSKQTLAKLIKDYGVKLVSIGNGTASRETEQLVNEVLTQNKLTNTQKVVVSEAGASVYSASEIAQQEFPQLDVTIRGAISIGRRLQDPLAELVKIDPKAIGVGQYQHDVNQTALALSLQNTVEDCVNSVGVDLNTASSALLSYVSGLSSRLAQEIVKWRDENGSFRNRQQLKKVPRLGPKAFEQCAGFLRIREGEHPLDQSAVHPESYEIVEKMASKLGVDLAHLIGQTEQVKRINATEFVNENIGLMTLRDILSELEKPGRDPRPSFEVVKFDDAITEIKDLSPGLVLEGVVTNVTHFGAFVDVGVHQDGLVHISHLSNGFVSDPHTIVKAGQIVKVTVLEVDEARKRISLSMKTSPTITAPSLAASTKNIDKNNQSQQSQAKNSNAPSHHSLGTLADKFAALKNK
ncbi:MAG: RNA-binding transcriptional accessory protein [Thiomicrospira sp.]|uniref:Tex family protein n=1 Tax=Thiomicrospira sp. TaxID=935 RepID=UPI001A086B75|nr:Tex family protein [Thiomicrospira sp.]MBE0493382.1 RNA-binding transcriptional accessory protein [Thiomicrospira sp.]